MVSVIVSMSGNLTEVIVCDDYQTAEKVAVQKSNEILEENFTYWEDAEEHFYTNSEGNEVFICNNTVKT